MTNSKKPPKKAELYWETTPEGFVVPSGSIHVDPFAPKNKKWDVLDGRLGAPFNVAGHWPGGRK